MIHGLIFIYGALFGAIVMALFAGGARSYK